MAAQAPFDLGHEVFRKPQVIEGLLEGLSSPLRLAPITLQTLLRCAAATLSGFGVFFCGSFAGGHGALLQTILLVRHGEKETMSPKELNFKNFHGPHTVSLCS